MEKLFILSWVPYLESSECCVIGVFTTKGLKNYILSIKEDTIFEIVRIDNVDKEVNRKNKNQVYYRKKRKMFRDNVYPYEHNVCEFIDKL